MQIITVRTGVLQENTYIVFEEDGGKALIVDPGDDAPDILGELRAHNLTPVLILLTHGHHDHIGAITALQSAYGTPIAIHENDRHMLAGSVPQTDMDKFVAGDEILQGYQFDIQVLHTPGHSAGSVCYLINGVLFSGDTLFQGSIGRTDFPDSDPRAMEHSLDILRQLPGVTKVFPGHGAPTTIEQERRTNPWMR